MRCAAILLPWSLLLGVAPIAAADSPPQTEVPAAPLPSVTLPAALARVLTDYETAWRARDAKALAALFTGLRPWQSQVLYDGLPLSRRLASS